MSRSGQVKVLLYFLCISGVCIFGWLASKSYRAAAGSSEQRTARIDAVTGISSPTNSSNAVPALEDTNVAVIDPGAEAAETGAIPDPATTTNAAAALTNQMEDTADPGADDLQNVARVSPRSYTRMVTYGLGLLLSLIGLGVLVAHEVSQFLGRRAETALFNADGQAMDPAYEQAEDLAKDGKYLEAIQAMRDYLKKNPREQYVALRIAEIYEENLRNPLAAALEYEEVLKKNLPAERWGWAAIHLANIYSGKMEKPDKAIALLRRIDAEYGQTGAAKKARERLLQIDPDFVPSAAGAPDSTATAAGDDKPTSNLPPGFRPKS